MLHCSRQQLDVNLFACSVNVYMYNMRPWDMLFWLSPHRKQISNVWIGRNHFHGLCSTFLHWRCCLLQLVWIWGFTRKKVLGFSAYLYMYFYRVIASTNEMYFKSTKNCTGHRIVLAKWKKIVVSVSNWYNILYSVAWILNAEKMICSNIELND